MSPNISMSTEFMILMFIVFLVVIAIATGMFSKKRGLLGKIDEESGTVEMEEEEIVESV